MSKPKKKNEIYLTYESDQSGGGYEPGESGPYGCRKTTYRTFKLLGAWTTAQDWVETVEVDFTPKSGEKVYIIVVRYSTGDSFGRSNGHWHIEGAYNDRDEAEAIGKRIAHGNYKKDSYLPWNGYFEHLEEVSVEGLDLDEGKKVFEIMR